MSCFQYKKKFLLLCLYSADEKGLLWVAAEKEVVLLQVTDSGCCHPSGLAGAAGEPRIKWKVDYVPLKRWSFQVKLKYLLILVLSLKMFSLLLPIG